VRRRTATAVVMVLENCGYPLDARVRMEAESLVERGMSVEVLAPREPGQPKHECIRDVQVTRFRLLDGNGRIVGTALEYLAAAVAVTPAILVRLLRTRGGTLHVHNPPDLFFPLLWLARRCGWTTVFDHHDDAAGMLQDKLGRPTRVASILAWMRDRSAGAADLTITTNETQRALVQAAARRVIVVRNSPPLWFADHRPSPPDGRVRLVFLGEIGAQDRVERAVEILAQLVADEGIDAELLIIGDGPQRAAVEHRARALGISDRVTTTGWVAFEEVPVLLASAHIGLDTAPLTEVNHGSTMVKILEYLAVGLPVVASALRETEVTGRDALVTVEEDSVAAFLPPIIELLSSTDAWRASADRARARGTELLWPAQRRKLIDGYAELREHSARTTPAGRAANAAQPAASASGHRDRNPAA
jgi:glycosyltransferase involved in cell wall biosynthesis